MSFEYLDGFEDHSIKMRNLIQLKLVDLYKENLSEKVSSEERSDWIKKYAERFSEIISEHPEYVSLYNTDPGNALEEIQKKLYEGDPDIRMSDSQESNNRANESRLLNIEQGLADMDYEMQVKAGVLKKWREENGKKLREILIAEPKIYEEYAADPLRALEKLSDLMHKGD